MTRRMAEAFLVVGTAAGIVGVANLLHPASVFPTAATYICDVSNRERCTLMFIEPWSPALWVAAVGFAAIVAGFVMLRSSRLRVGQQARS